MPPSPPKKFPVPSLDPEAFILYAPKTQSRSANVLCCANATQVLSQSMAARSPVTNKTGDVSGFPVRWMTTLDKRLASYKKPKKGKELLNEIVDQFKSGMRHYRVRGVKVSHGTLEKKPVKAEKHCYLFILERICKDEHNLYARFRRWKLTSREQQVARLLVSDLGNQEIAKQLSISIHTVKGYMKTLKLKLGAKSRGGIISQLLSNKSSD